MLYTPEDIRRKLRALGATEAQSAGVITDVEDVIAKQTFFTYLQRLSPAQTAELEATPPEQWVTHIAAHADRFPPSLLPEEVERIADETWEGYFKAVTPAE